MTATATRDPTQLERGSDEGLAERLFEPGGMTLEDVVLDLWERLVVDGHAQCPVCGESMTAAGGCEPCGAELS